jgi:hypothetical protein
MHILMRILVPVALLSLICLGLGCSSTVDQVSPVPMNQNQDPVTNADAADSAEDEQGERQEDDSSDSDSSESGSDNGTSDAEESGESVEDLPTAGPIGPNPESPAPVAGEGDEDFIDPITQIEEEPAIPSPEQGDEPAVVESESSPEADELAAEEVVVSDCPQDAQTGDVCESGAIFVGPISPGRGEAYTLMVTPSGCELTSHPLCLGFESDFLMMDWNRAQQYCNAMDFAGYTDWDLPTKYELSELFCRAQVGRQSRRFPQDDPSCASRGGKQEVLGGFQSANYWSGSVESDNEGSSWRQLFSDGSQFLHLKSHSSTYVRCVRRQQM